MAADVFEVKAMARHVAISPQKVRLVVNAVRGMGAQEALDTLSFMPQKSAQPVWKVVNSAVANAQENYGLDADDLYVHRIFADDGPRSRLRPYGGRFGGRGRFKPIINRTSHITVVLAERNPADYE